MVFIDFMNEVREVRIILPHSDQPTADWADCYQVTVDRPFYNARAAAEAIVAALPAWQKPLMKFRGIVVTPLGLKRSAGDVSEADKIGFFPITYESETKLIVGFDDKHLNFRIVIAVQEGRSGQVVSSTTLITRHNALGIFYLEMVLPFQRAIVRSALSHI